MATGIGNLPYTMSPVSPFDVITSQAENERIANIESLADGTGIGDGAITSGKLDFTTLSFGNYSTTEVDTGFKDTLNDAIYVQTFSGTITAAIGSRTSTVLAASGIKNVLASDGYWNIGVTGFNNVVGGYDAIGRSSAVSSSDTSGITLITQSNTGRTSSPYVVRVFYTKV